MAVLPVCVIAQARAEPVLTMEAWQGQLRAAQQVAQRCRQSAAACDGSSLPEDATVTTAGGRRFAVRWQWMRDELAAAKTAQGPERVKHMTGTEAHLSALLQAEGEVQGAAMFGRARGAADAALARAEFRTAVSGPSLWQRVLAHLQDGLLRFFGGVDRLGRRAPWLAPLIEWGCFVLAAAGLLWFVRRSLARQSLRIALGDAGVLRDGVAADAPAWERLSEERAAAGDWRGAIHMMYWAAVVLLDDRRAWKPSATRTPRELLRLLRQDSAAEVALRELTVSLESAWYGGREVGRTDYEASRRSLAALKEARLERAGAGGERGEAMLAPLGSA